MRLSLSVSRARVSCDIQIRQFINDIKWASALADCVPLSRSATVINRELKNHDGVRDDDVC